MSYGALDDGFSELIGALEDDPRFDVECFLREHPEQASALRARLEKLRRAGLLAAPSKTRRILDEMRERFAIATTAPPSAKEPANPVELLPSRVVGGRYRVLAEIGRGGMGRVFRARDVDLGRDVALKVIDLDAVAGPDAPQRRAFLERFLGEAQVTAQLEHPSIVPLHDIGIDRTDQLYYTMKLVEGRTLESLIEKWHARAVAGEPFPISELLRIVLQICDALAFAHERGVLHRDLKPSNVMVGRFGEVHLMDWGLAKVLGTGETAPGGAAPSPTRTGSPTVAGDVLGTPSHMAPEQAAGNTSAVDHRADVYGVGAILWHALAGEPPNRRDRAAVLDWSVPIPRELRSVCARALAFERSERYPSIAELAADLRAFLQARPGTAWSDSPLRSVVKWVRRHPTRATALGVGAVSLCLLVGAGWFLRDQDERLRAVEHQRKVAKLSSRMEQLLQAESDDSPLTTFSAFSGQAEQALALLAEWDLRFDASSSPVETAARIDGVAEPEVRDKLVELLFLTFRFIGMSGLGHAAEYAERGVPPEEASTNWAGMAEARPEATAAWPRLLECTQHITGHDVGKASALALRSHLLEESFDLAPLMPMLASCSSADLDLFSFVAYLVADGKSHQRSQPERAARRGEEILDRLLELRPDHAVAHVRRGNLAARDGDNVTARLHWTAAVAAWPRSSGARINLAFLAAEDGNLAAEERMLRAVLTDDPDHYGALRNLAENQFVQERYEECLELLDRVEQRSALLGEQCEILLKRAVCLSRIGERDGGTRATSAALDAYAELLRQCPEDWRGHMNLGGILLDAGRFLEALSALEGAVCTAPVQALNLDAISTDQATALWDLGWRVEALQKLVGYLKQRPATTRFSREQLREYAEQLEGVDVPDELERDLLELLVD